MASKNQYKSTILVIIFIVSQASCRPFLEDSMLEKHEEWMERHGRVYKNAEEKERRLMIFKDNVNFIQAFNEAMDKPYTLSVNEFADQTNEEFIASRNGYKKQSHEILYNSKPKYFLYENVTAVPPSMDWRSKGAVTPMKDQGQCG